MDYRTEHDTMGEIDVPATRNYGAQTARSLIHFAIGEETIPEEVLRALILLKHAAASANEELQVLDKVRADAIREICDLLVKDSSYGVNPAYAEDFPLKVWQTGSGTQSNMNVNEVIAHLANGRLQEDGVKDVSVHPNDHVNRSQSSNDTFPTAMHLAAVTAIRKRLFPAIDEMTGVLREKETAYNGVIKIGRTHLMDAVPLTFSQELSGYRTMLTETKVMIEESLTHLSQLAIGGTAVGTGLNCPEGFDERCVQHLSDLTGIPFTPAPNKFHALSSKDAFVHTHGALKALAVNLMKIAEDIRLMASGPRAGLHEITIPENEPGSSIMPGKVNPTQCEAMTMIAAEVMGNDTTIAVGASGGQFELNVFMPVLAYNMMQSVRLLSDGITSFTTHCLKGMAPDTGTMQDYVNRSLMLVTALTPEIGYENAARAARKAHLEHLTLKEAVTLLGLMDEADYDKKIRPERMI